MRLKYPTSNMHFQKNHNTSSKSKVKALRIVLFYANFSANYFTTQNSNNTRAVAIMMNDTAVLKSLSIVNVVTHEDIVNRTAKFLLI
jgi:hypothetical protein